MVCYLKLYFRWQLHTFFEAFQNKITGLLKETCRQWPSRGWTVSAGGPFLVKRDKILAKLKNKDLAPTFVTCFIGNRAAFLASIQGIEILRYVTAWGGRNK